MLKSAKENSIWIKVTILIGIILMMSFSTCGKKEYPMPPISYIPEPPESIVTEQLDKHIALSWKAPKRFVDGRNLKSHHKKYMSYIVTAGLGKKKKILGSTHTEYFFDTTPRKPDDEVCYSIIAIYRKKYKSAPTNPVCIRIKSYPLVKPKVEYTCEGDKFIKIKFKKNQFDGIVIYKKSNKVQKPERAGLLSGEKTLFTDKNVKNNAEYIYFARYISNGTQGLPSRSVVLTPKDEVPPDPPGNPRIVTMKNKYILLWEPSKSRDIKAYIITENGKNIAIPGNRLYFLLKHQPSCLKITAVDKAGNKSKSIPVCREEE